MSAHRLQIAEYFFMAGSVVGWSISVASGQLIYAAVPVTVALLLNLINRLRWEQRTRRRLNSAIAQLHRQLSQESHSLYEQQLEQTIASVQARVPRYFSPLETSDAQSNVSETLRRSADGNISQLQAQLANLEQSLNRVVQYLNSSSLPARVEQLENAIASATAEIAKIQRQRSDVWKRQIEEIERRLQVLEQGQVQLPRDQAVTESSFFPPTAESEPVAVQDVPSPLPTWSHLHTLTGHSDWVSCLGISTDGQTLVSGSFDTTIKLWHLSTGTLTGTLSAHSKGVLSLAISADGKTLASGSFDETIKVWRLDAGELIYTLTGHTGSVRSLAITSDNQRLVSGSFDQTIKLWRLDTGEFLGNLTKNAGQVSAIVLTPDEQTLVSGSTDGLVILWSLNPSPSDTNPFRCALPGNLSSVCALTVSPDGQILVAGCTDGTIKLWRLDTLTLLDVFQGHSGAVMSAVLSVDGQLLITGSADGTLKIWHLKAARQLAILTNDSFEAVQAVAVSPDLQWIASGGAGNMIEIWQRD